MRYLLVVAALLLAGCETDPDALRTQGGKILGKPNWVEIEAAESRLRLPEYDYKVEGYEKTDMRDRYIEYVDFANGYLKLENAYGAGFAEPTSQSGFERMFEDLIFNKEPIVTDTWDLRRAGRLIFAEFVHTDLLCIAMTKTLGKPLPMAGFGMAVNEGYMKAVLCDLRETDSFTDQAVDFGKNVKMRDYKASSEKEPTFVDREEKAGVP